jgi:hypothetical protein
MMDDQDLEARLAAYRPAGPPPSLRARVTEVRADGRRARVAAMLLAATFYWLAASGRDRIFAQLPPVVTPALDLNLEAQP